MKLKDFNFNNTHVKGLSIFVDGKEIAMGYTGEVLQGIPHLAEYEIESTNYFFNVFVIRLKGETIK